MTRKKLSGKAACPCGSGKKYERCCWDKGFEGVEDERGNVYRSTPPSPEVQEVLRPPERPCPGTPLFPGTSQVQSLE
jgi:hypothetical protein